MFTLLLWLGVFVLGLVIYFAPVFLNRRMYEGFADNDTKEYLKKLKEIVQPLVTGTPELAPEGAETNSSTPSPSNPPQTISDVLAQGAAFQETIPAPIPEVEKAPANSATGLTSSSIPPVCPPPKIKYVKVPNKCPDMSQYIRKDSIPCWSCKLG
jgi:hypothetical protein